MAITGQIYLLFKGLCVSVGSVLINHIPALEIVRRDWVHRMILQDSERAKCIVVRIPQYPTAYCPRW
ncbi:hypothetical protein ASPWEDRAFT_46846, partial [Aspergillus wentii DTO 134E9]